MKKVVVIQRRMAHYRLPFFEQLRSELGNDGIELVVGAGTGTYLEECKRDGATLAWAQKLRTVNMFAGKLCWQPFGHLLSDADMVVVTLENKLIYNLVAQFIKNNIRVGLWGHGANLQGDPGSLQERYKRIVARRADWWFGYTAHSLPHIAKFGFPVDRITVLNNAVETSQVAAAVTGLARTAEMHSCRGIYVGSLYREKRIDFLLEAALEIRRTVPTFELTVVGAGPEETRVKAFATSNEWVKYRGALFGSDKAAEIVRADVMLNPGLVGLGILDSFASGVPLVTTDCGIHSPEIAYLESGVNGLLTNNSIQSFVAGVTEVLNNEAMRERLRERCLLDSKKYSVKNMARNFAHGIGECLSRVTLRQSIFS